MNIDINSVDYLRRYKKLLLVGPHPPPLGGVSVHIYRLNKLLPDSSVFNMLKYGKGSLKAYLCLLLRLLHSNFDAVHLHTLTLKLFVVVYLAKIFRTFDVIVTDHNSRLVKDKNKFQLSFFRLFLLKADVVIVVGSHILRDYAENGIILEREVFVENSFLAPPLEEEKHIIASYPSSFNDFLSNKSPIITANAYQIVFDNGIDLYGLDMCVDLVERLIPSYPNLGFVFALANESVNEQYFSFIVESLQEKEISDNLFFLTGQQELWPIFKRADLMVRPTSTDGFGISVAEALYFGCSAVASDVCERADGTIIFESRNMDDFSQKVTSVLSGRFPSTTSKRDDVKKTQY